MFYNKKNTSTRLLTTMILKIINIQICHFAINIYQFLFAYYQDGFE